MSDDLKIIKERIYVEERIEELLEKLGCGHIKKGGMGMRYECSLPNGNNLRSVQVKINESLTTNIRSKGISGDIFHLVGFILYDCETFEQLTKQLYDIKSWVCKTLGYDDLLKGNKKNVEQKEKAEWNGWLKQIKGKRATKTKTSQQFKPNKIIRETALIEFRTPLSNKWWLKEGLSLKTQIEFEVGFDLDSERITFAVRNKEGKLVGVKGRYVGKDKYIQKEKKYMYIYRCNKSIELFNLHRALPYIEEKREVIVVEGAKTCMLGWQYGVRNMVSIEGDALTPVQAKMLRDLGLEISLVFAFDKDKGEQFVKDQVKQITGRSSFMLFDSKGLFSDKDSPMDKGINVWNKFYTECKKRV